MARTRRGKRLALGVLAGALAFGPLALAAGAQDEAPEPAPAPADPVAILTALSVYSGELFSVDFDGDGVPDITDSDNDGIPEVPQGEPGERDITPGNPLFLAPITAELEALGLNTVVSIDDDSELLHDCGGMAMSFTSDGELKDWAIGIPSNEGGGPTGQLVDIYGDNEFGTRAFTKDNPFKVHDIVVYFGRLPGEGEGPLEHNWTIKTAGISLDKGGDPNPNGKNRNAGEVNLDEELDSWLRPSGIFPMKGELTSENGVRCTAEGWVQFEGGNPFLSVPSAIAAAFGGAGIIGLLFNSRPAVTWKG